jgi:hypothetical protein
VLIVKDPRAIAALVGFVVFLALAHRLVRYVHGVGDFEYVRPLLGVVAVLVACVAGDRYGKIRVLGWTSIGALLFLAVARLVPIKNVASSLLFLAEASLDGGIPLTLLVAQDLRWVSRALVTGLVFGLRYWSEYLAIIIVGVGIGDGDVTAGIQTNVDGMVIVAAVLIAVGYLTVRVFDRLAPAPSVASDETGSGA